MGNNKKSKKKRQHNKNGPAFYDDQLGENPAEGRIEKKYKEKKGK